MQLLKPKQAIAVAVAFAAAGIGMFADGSVSAKSFEPSDIGTQSYVIGEHLFTRETNPDAGYEGYINTRMIMLAAKTIQGNTLEDMDIYYKKTDGTWVDGLTNEAISDMPSDFNIRFKNLSYHLATPTLTATAVGPSVWYDGYNEEAKKNYSGTASYVLEATNHDDYSDTIDGVATTTIDKVEFLVRKADLEQNTTYASSCGATVTVNNVAYCQVEDGDVKTSSIYSTTTPIAEFGKTYHFISRIKYTYKGKITYSQYSDEVSVTAPNYHQATVTIYPGNYDAKLITGGEDMAKDLSVPPYGMNGYTFTKLIPDGGTIEELTMYSYGMYGSTFEGWYVARACTTEEKTALGVSADTHALCPSDTQFTPNAAIHSDIEVVAKWRAHEFSIKIAPVDALSSLMGIATIYDDGAELGHYGKEYYATDGFSVYTLDGILLFNSENPSIALSEVTSGEKLKLSIPYGGGKGTFETTATVTIVSYGN